MKEPLASTCIPIYGAASSLTEDGLPDYHDVVLTRLGPATKALPLLREFLGIDPVHAMQVKASAEMLGSVHLGRLYHPEYNRTKSIVGPYLPWRATWDFIDALKAIGGWVELRPVHTGNAVAGV